MFMRLAGATGILAGLLLLALGSHEGPRAFAQGGDGKTLIWKEGLSFQVRKAGETDFTDKTQKYGAEIFEDKAINQLVYIDELGALSLGSAAKAGSIGDTVKAPRLFYALEMVVREVGESKFEGGKTRKFGCEVFNDVNAENLVFITEKGYLAVTPTGALKEPAKVQNPEWFHGMELKVRKAGEKEFTDKTAKISLEVYKDPNSNQLIYITDKGAIAIVAAGTTAKPATIKDPVWFYAFESQVRKADEDKFSMTTKKIGAEVYKDENANTLIFVTETGDLAVIPAGTVAKPSPVQDPKLLTGRSFRVRKADEKDFNEKTQKFGAEIYVDPNSGGSKIYLSETGAIAVTK